MLTEYSFQLNLGVGIGIILIYLGIIIMGGERGLTRPRAILG